MRCDIILATVLHDILNWLYFLVEIFIVDRNCTTWFTCRWNYVLKSSVMRIKYLFNITRNTFCRTWSLSNATFSFGTSTTWRLSSSKSAAVYKISSKSDDFALRYGDITIFKMAAVRHLGIVLPPYETTHEVSVAACGYLSKFCANLIQRSEDIAIWIFSHIWLEMPIQAPKWGFWGTLDP